MKTKTKLSDLLDVRLLNRSMSPLTVSSPTLAADARLGLEIQGKMPGWRPAINVQSSDYGVKRQLQPRGA